MSLNRELGLFLYYCNHQIVMHLSLSLSPSLIIIAIGRNDEYNPQYHLVLIQSVR